MFADMIAHRVKTKRSKRSSLKDPWTCPLCLRTNCRLVSGRCWTEPDGSWRGKVQRMDCVCGNRFSWRKV